MEEQMDKYSEDLVKKIIEQVGVEQPSKDFTSNLMSKIEAISSQKQFVYKPVISKSGLYAIAASIIGLVLFMTFNMESTSLGWLDGIDIRAIFNYNLSNIFPEIGVSKYVLYAITMFGVMFFVQANFIKHYYDKRFQI